MIPAACPKQRTSGLHEKALTGSDWPRVAGATWRRHCTSHSTPASPSNVRLWVVCELRLPVRADTADCELLCRQCHLMHNPRSADRTNICAAWPPFHVRFPSCRRCPPRPPFSSQPNNIPPPPPLATRNGASEGTTGTRTAWPQLEQQPTPHPSHIPPRVVCPFRPHCCGSPTAAFGQPRSLRRKRQPHCATHTTRKHSQNERQAHGQGGRQGARDAGQGGAAGARCIAGAGVHCGRLLVQVRAEDGSSSEPRLH
jgi:hypothetical protein